MKKLNSKFWFSLVLFGLIGQIAWIFENMFLNVYIYNIFNASANDISLMVSLSAITATITTLFMGAFIDKYNKRKIFMCAGYILWGISLFAFSLLNRNILSSFISDHQSLLSAGIISVIILDCIMTFFGSTSNDAAFNAWVCDKGAYNARGKIEGILSLLPLLSMFIVFVFISFYNLTNIHHWNIIFQILSVITIVCGISGFYLLEDTHISSDNKPLKELLLYPFKKEVFTNNKMLYALFVLFTIFSISIQIFMPYLLIYYEYTLAINNFIPLFVSAVLIAGIFTYFYSSVYDLAGFKTAIIPSTIILIISYIILYLTKQTSLVFIGTVLMMMGYMSGISVYGACIKDFIPADKTGQFQGIRLISAVLIPGIIGPMIGSNVLSNAPLITNNDGTQSFLPDSSIFLASFITMILLCIVLYYVFKMIKESHYNLYTDKSETINKDKPWSLYPRPQLKREGYMMLNGKWQLDGKDIIVPFCPESLLSDYKGKIKEEMTYTKIFTVPSSFSKERILVHFDGVDQISELYINNKYVGKHIGGYLRFTYDITDYIYKDKDNVLELKVTDKLSKIYPYGKQTKNRGGMWYTPVTGIHKSVWLENVSQNYIEGIKIEPDLKGINLKVNGNIDKFKVIVYDDNHEYEYMSDTKTLRIDIENPKLWDPDHPYLYQFKIITQDDEIESYFALRTIQIKEINGIQRVLLNNKPVFLHGVLDQGYFSDGHYTPADEYGYEEDILNMKELGFNMLRKHIKIESDYFYYACDKLGMLVMQDMVNNGSYNFIMDTVVPTYISKKRDDTKKDFNSETSQFFIEHTLDTITQLYNYPSIISYCIFNEGWGQFHSDRVYKIVKDKDPSRIIDSTSGWFAQSINEFDSEHIYFKKIDIQVKERPYLVSECGGFTMKCNGYIYSKYNTYGYGVCENSKILTDKITDLYETMIIPKIKEGVCGCVYTQVSDVEDEINGLYTYDRKICKVDKEKMQLLSEKINNQLDS